MADADFLGLDIFETLVTVTPQQEISKTLNSSKIHKKYLRLTLGNEHLLLGNERLLLVIIGAFGFLEFLFFVAGGFWDSVGRGAP